MTTSVADVLWLCEWCPSISVCVSWDGMCSHHSHLSSLLNSFYPLFHWLAFSSFSSLVSLKKNLPSLCLTLCFLYCFPPCFSISQSQIPGTVIPLCAAQFKRMFNTTRTPGEETGKDMCSHVDTHRHILWQHGFETVLIYDTWCFLNITSNDEARWMCLNRSKKPQTENCVHNFSRSKASWFTESLYTYQA